MGKKLIKNKVFGNFVNLYLMFLYFVGILIIVLKGGFMKKNVIALCLYGRLNDSWKKIIVILAVIIVLIFVAINKESFVNNSVDNTEFDCKYSAENYIKNGLKNPDSFNAVNESYEKLEDGSVVHLTYRGTNSFNAIVTESISVYFDKNNNIVGAM